MLLKTRVHSKRERTIEEKIQTELSEGKGRLDESWAEQQERMSELLDLIDQTLVLNIK